MRSAHICLIVGCAFLVVGCTQTGDFGRKRAGLVSDTILPALGRASTWSGREPVSHFNYTNDEQTLRDLGWSIVTPPHTRDWIGYANTELQRTEIARRLDLRASPQSYSRLLSGTSYRSSDARYARIMDDAAKDISAIAPYMALARRVKVADEQRLAAATALPDLGASELAATYGRVAENQRQMAWVKRALLFRLYSYRYAVDRLMIQTPSRLGGDTIARLDALEDAILRSLVVEPANAEFNQPDQIIDLTDTAVKL
ncbi:MAG: hypothetical protein AAF590_04315 [Pseudomonadota bacterium]